MTLYERVTTDIQRIIDNLDEFKNEMLASQSTMSNRQAELTERLAATIQTTERLENLITRISKDWNEKYQETVTSLGERIEILDKKTDGLDTTKRLVWAMFSALAVGVITLVVGIIGKLF